MHFYVRSLCFFAVAVGLAACSVPGGSGAPSTGMAPAARAGASTLSVSPAKLNFTVTPKLVLTISEKGYTGKFTLTLAQAGLVKLSATSAKGPGPAKVSVTAKNAGTTTLVVADANGNSKKVAVTVTQGVIIIQ